MCLTTYRPSINEFKAYVATLPADANGDKWLIGYKNFRFRTSWCTKRHCYVPIKTQIITPYRYIRVTEQVMVADKQRRKMIVRDDIDIDNGIHFHKTENTAKFRYDSPEVAFTAKVFVKVADVTGVGLSDVVANKITIADEDWKKYWVANKANTL